MATYISAFNTENNFQHFGYEFFINPVIEKIKKYLKEKDISLEKNEIDEIYNFLLPLVDGKVWVVFKNDLPTANNYPSCIIELKTHRLHLAYDVNCVEENLSNPLYVYVEVVYERKFKLFWKEKYLPTCLLDEAMEHLDVTQHIVVHVFETVFHWQSYLKNAKNPIIIGQDIESKDFKTFKPVGFVDGNYLVITSPNDKNDPVGITYNFN